MSDTDEAPTTFHAALVITATAYATHPEGAVVPAAAEVGPAVEPEHPEE